MEGDKGTQNSGEKTFSKVREKQKESERNDGQIIYGKAIWKK
jgi:hypothetical protein